MQIFVDADACPVVRIVEQLARKHATSTEEIWNGVGNTVE